MESKKYTREDAVSLLKEKSDNLGRLPKRSDFSEAEVVAIKAFLGPMPRALEAAGLKEATVPTVEKNRIKRQKKKQQLKSNKKQGETK